MGLLTQPNAPEGGGCTRAGLDTGCFSFSARYETLLLMQLEKTASGSAGLRVPSTPPRATLKLSRHVLRHEVVCHVLGENADDSGPVSRIR